MRAGRGGGTNGRDKRARMRGRGDTTELGEAGEWRMELDGALVAVGRASADAGHPFVPVGVGDAWVYAVSQSTGVTSEASEAIVAVRRDGERTIARVRGVSAGGVSERDLVIDRRGVSPDIGAMTTASGVVETIAADGVYLPKVLTPGCAWRWRQSLAMPGSTVEVEGAGEALGEVEVTVPAGVFVAVHVRGAVRSRMKAATGPLEVVQTDDNFYVRGVGLVRSVTATGHGYVSEKVLLRWSVGG